MGTSDHACISLIEINERIVDDQELNKAIQKIDVEQSQYYCSVMEKTFSQVWIAEHENDYGRLSFLKDIFFTTAEASMRHIDQIGLTSAIGKVLHHFEDFSFEQNAVNMAFDQHYLTKVLGVPGDKVRHFWPFVDQHKLEIITLMSAPGFCLESLVEPAKELFSASGGEEWEHMSPGFWRRMAGFGLGCANVGLAGVTWGIGTPLAAASVATGAAAVAAG